MTIMFSRVILTKIPLSTIPSTNDGKIKCLNALKKAKKLPVSKASIVYKPVIRMGASTVGSNLFPIGKICR